jgi:hypothetical protein
VDLHLRIRERMVWLLSFFSATSSERKELGNKHQVTVGWWCFLEDVLVAGGRK